MPSYRHLRKADHKVHPADRVDHYYVSLCSAKGYKEARRKAGVKQSPAEACSYHCCWMVSEIITKETIEKFPRYLRHGHEYGAESHGFKKHGDPNRKRKFGAGEKLKYSHER